MTSNVEMWLFVIHKRCMHRKRQEWTNYVVYYSTSNVWITKNFINIQKISDEFINQCFNQSKRSFDKKNGL